MREASLFLLFAKPLTDIKARYMVTGSVAATLFGEPRLTNDVDIVLQLDGEEAKRLPALFPLEHFYCPPEEIIRVESGRFHNGHFNLIHHQTGYKADIYLSGNDPLNHWGLDHAVIMDVEGISVHVAPPEYVILKKLAFFREGGSEKHIRDIQTMLRVMRPGPDMVLIRKWVGALNLQREWEIAIGSPGETHTT